MTPIEFVRKWNAGSVADGLNEKSSALSHFIDLCRVLGVPEPNDPDNYCFERGLEQTGGKGGRTDGWADVWKRGHFAWDKKRPGENLRKAAEEVILRRRLALNLERAPAKKGRSKQ